MYKIILIDDDNSELVKIRRTIKANQPSDCVWNTDYIFEEYAIAEFDTEDKCVERILNDIDSKSASLYIIDYKLLTNKKLFKGNEIFYKVANKVPEFPIVILTERAEESMSEELVDADKVYEKEQFFKLEEQYSRNKVTNLFHNMKRYATKLNSLENDMKYLLDRIAKEKMNPDIVRDITSLEMEMSKYLPFQISMSEQIYDANRLREVVSLLTDVRRLIED